MEALFSRHESLVLGDHSFNIYCEVPRGGPLIVMHHGMGSTSATFALFSREILKRIQGSGALLFDARYHGLSHSLSGEPPNFRMEDMVKDCELVVKKACEVMGHSGQTILVGHSMGATVVSIVCQRKLVHQVAGLVVLDAVEGFAQQALQSMPSMILKWPQSFETQEKAVAWSLSSQLNNPESAAISVPAMLQRKEDGSLSWRIDLSATRPYWGTWFEGLDNAFLGSPTARLLVLPGTSRLDKELTVGQMQGKYQLVVLTGCGHFIQEDQPSSLAITVSEFWERNNQPLNLIPKFGAFRSKDSKHE